MGIVEFVARRLALLVPTLLGVSFLVFLMLHLTPGDPVTLIIGIDNYTEERAEEVREQLGLNDPFLVQYGRFLANAVRGDFGDSIRLRRDALGAVLERLPATFEITLLALGVALLVAVPVGVIAAVKRNTVIDQGTMVASLLGIAIPNFWLALILIILFSINLGWLPPSGRHMPITAAALGAARDGAWGDLFTTLRHLVLPCIALGAAQAGLLTRLVRSTFIEVLHNDYIRTARTKGVPPVKVLGKHALRNALIPVVTVLGLQLGTLMGGAIVTETVFSWPGVGRLVVTSIFTRDFPVVQTAVLVIAVLVVGINLLVDVLYAVIDPRIRYG